MEGIQWWGELDGQPFTESVIFCESGKTIVEFGFVYEERRSLRQARVDSRIKHLVFNVDKRAAPTRRRSQIRSRGIDNVPPVIIPDPEPPALPNFELQREKP
jgi:hypothetical protein